MTDIIYVLEKTVHIYIPRFLGILLATFLFTECFPGDTSHTKSAAEEIVTLAITNDRVRICNSLVFFTALLRHLGRRGNYRQVSRSSVSFDAYLSMFANRSFYKTR